MAKNSRLRRHHRGQSINRVFSCLGIFVHSFDYNKDWHTPICRAGLVLLSRFSDRLGILPQGITSDRSQGTFRTNLMSRLTRTTVNLLLMVAISLQQSVAPALQQSISFACAARGSDQQCSCCADRGAESHGPCCRMAATETSREKAGCCQRTQPAAAAAAAEPNQAHATPSVSAITHSEPHQVRDEHDAEHVRPEADSECCARHAAKVSIPGSVIKSGCHCVHAPAETSVPLAPVSRTSTSDILQLMTLVCASMSLDDLQPQVPRGVSRADRGLSSCSHFVQIHLCVWRI